MTNVAIEISERSPSAVGRQLGGLYAIWLREIKRAIRDRGQLIGGISRPLLWVVIMGIGLTALSAESESRGIGGFPKPLR